MAKNEPSILGSSLWADCLFRCMEKADNEGHDEVRFCDVEDMLGERAKRITEWKEEPQEPTNDH